MFRSIEADIFFHVGRSSTLQGSTGTAFTLAFQSCIGQVGGAIGPQLFQSKWASDNYKPSFAICCGASIIALFANIWTAWLTRNVEYDVRRVLRLRQKAHKEGKILADDDINVFEERQFYVKGQAKPTAEPNST
jgi:hypothetical protein